MSNIITTVSAVGEASASNDLANFALSFVVRDATAPLTKNRLKARVGEFEAMLGAICDQYKINIVKDSVTTATNVVQSFEYDANTGTNNPAGFQGTYSTWFQTDSMEQVSALYDELASLADVNCPAPTFSLKNNEELSKAALENARDKVFEKFKYECSVLGLNPNDYVIASWEVLSTGAAVPGKKKMGTPQAINAFTAALEEAIAPGTPSKITQSMIGVAKVSVTLNISFKNK